MLHGFQGTNAHWAGPAIRSASVKVCVCESRQDCICLSTIDSESGDGVPAGRYPRR